MGINIIEKTLHHRLFREVNAHLGNYISFNRNCTVETVEQTFFPGSKLLAIKDYNCIPVSSLMVVDNGVQTFLLSGAAQWESILKNVSINLNIKNVLEYLKLYYSTYTLPYNHQRIVESIDDIDFTEFPKSTLFEDISQQIQIPVVISSNDQFTIYCYITAEQSLSDAAFKVFTNGKVVLLEKKIVLSSLPIGEMVVDL